MAKQTINIGTKVNSGGGDPLRTAFTKTNENFTELYTRITTAEGQLGISNKGGVTIEQSIIGSVIGADSTVILDHTTGTITGKLVGDVKGSVVADDSTVLIDGVAGTINGSALTGPLTANLTINSPIVTGISDFTGCTIVDLKNTAVDFTGSTITGTGFISSAEIDTKISTATSSIVIPSGSTQSIDVVAADSTLLVDSVNGTLNATTLTGALPAINGSALTNVTATFANITSTPTTLAGYGITDGLQLGTSATTALAGNTTFSFASLTGKPTTRAGYGITDAFDGAFASLSGKPTTIAGYGITDTLTSAADDITVGDAAVSIATSTGDITIDAQGSDTDIIFKGTDDADDITALTLDMSDNGKAIFKNNIQVGVAGHKIDFIGGTTTIVATNNPLKLNTVSGSVQLQYNGSTKLLTNNTGIEVNGDIEFGSSGAKLTNNTADLVLEPAGGKNLNINNNSGTTVFSVLSNVTQMSGGIQIKQGVEETFSTLTGSTGVVEHDCNNGQVFYHTGAAGDITANFTNLNSTQEHTTNLIVIINQGATPYEVTAVQIAGAAQTINWQGGSQPTGNANGIDSFSFTILNDGGTYVVLGQMVDFT